MFHFSTGTEGSVLIPDIYASSKYWKNNLLIYIDRKDDIDHDHIELEE